MFPWTRKKQFWKNLPEYFCQKKNGFASLKNRKYLKQYFSEKEKKHRAVRLDLKNALLTYVFKSLAKNTKTSRSQSEIDKKLCFSQ